MILDNLPLIVMILTMLITLAYFTYSSIKHGSIRSGIFGGRSVKNIGEVSSQNKMNGIMLTTKLRVNHLEGRNGRSIGIEAVAKTMLSYQLLPVIFNLEQTKELIALLNKTVESFERDSNQGGSI